MATKQQWLESIAVAKHLHEYGAMAAEQRLMETWVIHNLPRQAPAPVSQQWSTATHNPYKNTYIYIHTITDITRSPKDMNKRENEQRHPHHSTQWCNPSRSETTLNP